MSEKNIQVSDLFIHLFKMLNVTDISEQMKQLTRKELLMLIILGIDSYPPDDTFFLKNLSLFKDELKSIRSLQSLDIKDESTSENTDPDLKDLASETGEKYINIKKIKDLKGKELPDPTTIQEAIELRRDININTIME